MNDPEILDALFHEAITAIDAGDESALERLLIAHPRLVRERLEVPGEWLRSQIGNALEGFFQKPYLLWFVAEDAVRVGKLPPNITQITGIIIQAAQREGVESLQEQLDFTLHLVAWSRVARECEVQIPLIDVLADAGASLDGAPNNALVNGNFAAARHLVERDAPMTLAAALCLERWDDVARLAPTASAHQKQFSFILAALNGKSEAVARVISYGVELNGPSADLYSHATALHHAVCSGSLDTVRLLVEAGADLKAKDTNNNGTPLGWAKYYQGENGSNPRGQRYAEIADYLHEKEG